ncbi:MAG: response regulator transcription factor [Ruminococcus flavefaciens]|nr:MAG: Transcriptional regulatory protein YycF [Firmicutes bacterium ADurb.BinA205]HQM00799.1 response regulator transcription factor [Ruminococcus flavefaciens]
MKDILMIEDDPELGTLVRDFLCRAELSVDLFGDAESGIAALGNETYRLILLDVMLPKKDGYTFCSELRKKYDTPVLMMSARDDDQSKLTGYGTGADDYITKPFSIPVLLAKIRALMKRAVVKPENHEISGCGITLDMQNHVVRKNGTVIKLNVKEYELLRTMMEHQGEIMDKNKLFDTVWGFDCFSEPSTVSVHIRWLREKIEDDPNEPKIIQTVWKAGYRFGGGN